jgi:hypothetical protein
MTPGEQKKKKKGKGKINQVNKLNITITYFDSYLPFLGINIDLDH